MAGFRHVLIATLASHVAGEYELGVGGLVYRPLNGGLDKFPPWNPAPITLAKLNIDEASVSVAGCSHAGDFAHQFHVAFSNTVKNACVFSGQPFHCAVQAFQGEDQVVATPESSVPYCEGCAAGMTLAYDHCKNHPQHVDVGRLPDYPKRACGQNPINPHPPPGCIDLTGNLSESRVFLFHPSMDQCYLDGAVANTAALYSILVAEPQRTVKFVDDQPFPHCLPQNSTPYWGNSSEPSGYDGPGECLKHIYGHETPLAPVKNWTTAPGALQNNTYVFDQLEFIERDPDLNGTGVGPAGAVYIPTACQAGATACKLLLLTNGCGGSAAPNLSGSDWDFARWGESNDIILLKACVGGHVDADRFPNSYELQRGLLDVYGQTGLDYSKQFAPHMRFVYAVLQRVLHGA